MNWLSRTRASLKWKFIATALGIQVLCVMLITWVSQSTISTAMLDQSHRQVHTLLPMLNTTLAKPLFEEDLSVLRDHVRQIVDENNLNYLVITDTVGRKVVEHGQQNRGHAVDIETHLHSDHSQTHLQDHEWKFELKIGEFTVGYAAIEIDDSPIAETLNRHRYYSLTVAVIGIAVTLVLLTFTATLLTDGLAGLTRASRRLAEGDLSSRVEPHGSDELAELGKSFNRMAASLSDQQEDLRRRNERIRVLMDSTAEAICGLDKAGRCSFANQACLTLFGFEAEEDMLGTHLTDLLPVPEGYMDRLSRGLSCHNDDRRLETRDGRQFDLECWSHPVWHDGKVSGAVITILDITERRNAEARLRDSESRYRLLVENQTDLVVKVDAEGRFLFVSPGYCETFGIGANDLLGRSFMPLVHEDDRESTAEAMQDLYRPPYECTLEQRAKTAHGWRWFSWADKAVRGENGEVIAIVGVGRDITEQKIAEKALQASEAKLRAVVDNSPALIVMKNLAGEFRIMNGSDDERLAGGPTPLIEAISRAMEEMDKRTSGSSSGLRASQDLTIEHKHGVKRFYSLLTFPLLTDDGSPLGTGGMALDVTDQRQMQEALRMSEERFNLAVQGSSDGIWDWNLDSDEVYLSDRFKELLGYAAHEKDLDSGHWTFWVHVDDMATVSRVVNDHLVDHKPCSFECRLRCKSGDYRWFLVRGQAVRGGDGRPVRMAGSLTDITYRRESEARIRHLAYYDDLTGLPNRRMVLEELQRRLDTSRTDKQLGAVVFLDLDHFKRINDSLGHHYGDILLRQVANRLHGEIRSDDLVGRLGGDEFVLLMSRLGREEESARHHMHHITQKLISVLKAPYDLDGHAYHVTPSMGVILFPEGIESVEDVLKRADTALYASKNDGRDTVRFYQPEMQLAVDSRLSIEKDLRLALERNELDLFFQPQFGNHGELLLGAEALLRWHHPSRGWISPRDFIPIAEETGLIVPIGQWVLSEVAQKIAGWVASGILSEHLPISVNLSARQFFEHSLVDEIGQLLVHHGIAGGCLKLELTESILMHDIGEAIRKANLLKKHGIGFALDDFGTGYSSLAYLKTLPFDELKIDQSFVRDIPEDANDVAIIETIIAMAGHLGLRVVAEGVETQHQLTLLEEKGCNIYQGYLFSRPLPINEFEGLLKSHAISSAERPAQPLFRDASASS